MLLFNTLTGMKEYVQGPVATVEKLLSEKYGTDFTTTHIGDRFNTETTTLFCRTADNSSPGFTVVYRPLERTITDDLPARRAASAIDSEIAEGLAGNGITASSMTVLFEAECEGNASVTDPAEFVEASQTKFLLTRIAVKAESLTRTEADAVLSVLTETSRKYAGKDIKAALFLLPDAGYEECSKLFAELPRISDMRLRGFSPAFVLGISVHGGEAAFTAGDTGAAIKE
ncbi:MAG: hypothetical protein IKO47_03710 [Ruminococcus sp.]|nr:hypothetical protein [Ruminococcus sp.]